MLKASPSVALSESGGTIRRRTAGSRHLEDDECGLGAAGTCGTLYKIGRGERPSMGAGHFESEYLEELIWKSLRFEME